MPKIEYFNLNELQPIGQGFELNAYVPAANQVVLAGTALGQITSTSQSSWQTLALGGATGGTYVLSFLGQSTTALAYGANDAAIQAALVALTTIGAGNVLVASKVIKFQGSMANQPQPAIGIVDSTTGGTGATITATTQVGRTRYQVAAYATGNSDGTQAIIGVAKHDFVTDQYGNIWPAQVAGNASQVIQSVPVFVKGRFNSADLTGVDSGGLSGRGVLETGSLTTGIVRLF